MMMAEATEVDELDELLYRGGTSDQFLAAAAHCCDVGTLRGLLSEGLGVDLACRVGDI